MGCVRPAAAQDPNAAFDQSFRAGIAALGNGNNSQAHRAFSRCEQLVGELAPPRRAAGAFAATLFIAYATQRAGNVDAAGVHAQLNAVVAAAEVSGAWTQPGAEALRLRTLVLLWQTAPRGTFRRNLPDRDRDWLLRDDFFAIEPRRLQSMHTIARVLRFELALGTERELELLNELVRAERAGRDVELSVDEKEWRRILLGRLASYHAERRSFDRAQIYADFRDPAESLGLRAWLALQREDHAQAIALAREIVATGDPQGDQLLAEALEATGEAEAALRHYDKALAAAKGQAARAAAQNGRGDCLLRLGDRIAEAVAAYDAALAACVDDSIGALAERAETRKDLGRVAERMGDPVTALEHYLAALAIGEEARTRLLRDPFGGSWLGMHSDQTTAIDGVLRTWQPAGGEPWRVVHALELGRARGALDLAAGGSRGVDPVGLRALVTMRLEAADAATIERVAAEIDALRASHAGQAETTAVPPPAALRAFAEQHAGTAMLTWWLGREEAWLLVITGGAVKQYALAEPPMCRRQVALAWRAVASPRGDRAALTAAADCLLPAAARAELGDDVLAVVDPAMVRLPLAALDLGGEPFGTAVRLVQAPSLAVARLLGKRRASSAAVVVVQAPQRSPLADRLRLDPLQFAARECQAVLAAHNSSHHLADDAATLANLRLPLGVGTLGLGQRPGVLHIAAHAIHCPGLKTQSLVLLADGPAAMGGLGDLALPGTLVIFSACDAATGEQRGDEGVVGLVEGVFAAGARGVVAPVAPVNQQATADFMKVFHEALAQGLDTASALRRARRTLAQMSNYAHPHYWGAFGYHAGIEPVVAGGRYSAPVPVRWPFFAGIACLVALGIWLLLPGKQRVVGLR